MKSALCRLDGWFHAPVPRERLALLRVLIGGYALIYLIARAPDLLAPARYPETAFAPLGIVRLLDTPLAPGVLYAAYAAGVIGGVLFVLGTAYRWAAPLFSLLLLALLSYRHSWGMIFHTDNLLALHVPLLACAPAADAFALPRRAPRAVPLASTSGWVVRALCLVTVASYVVAGVAKLENLGLAWLGGEALREQIAYDALRKIELGSIHSPLGPWLLPHGWLFLPLSVFSLAAELLAPLALLGLGWAGVWCASAWLFHMGVLGTMAIVFPYPISGCAFVAFFPVERWFALALAKRRR
ncbi:MAG TPA: HTTM domain-containing protein [Polyangiaceae bacterium]|nr:HTTM domain-containing protein [Polyangiaceae bacterium]